jgi:hypothetical protein
MTSSRSSISTAMSSTSTSPGTAGECEASKGFGLSTRGRGAGIDQCVMDGWYCWGRGYAVRRRRVTSGVTLRVI